MNVLDLYPSPSHPMHREKIGDASPQSVVYAVFAGSEYSCTVPDFDLSHFAARHLYQGGEEAVKAVEDRDFPKVLDAIGLERAADIGDVVVEDGSAHAVGNAGGAAPDPGVLAPLPYAGHGCEVLERSQQ